jgi:hypothetical protein
MRRVAVAGLSLLSACAQGESTPIAGDKLRSYFATAYTVQPSKPSPD